MGAGCVHECKFLRVCSGSSVYTYIYAYIYMCGCVFGYMFMFIDAVQLPMYVEACFLFLLTFLCMRVFVSVVLHLVASVDS